MFIGPLIGIAGRVAGAAKGGVRLAGKGVNATKDASRWGVQGVASHPVMKHPLVNNPLTNNRVTRGAVNHPWVNNRVTRNTVGLMGGLALAGGRGIKKGIGDKLDSKTKHTLGDVFAGFAILLWIIDSLPLLGGVYSGFNLDPQSFWTNWVTQYTFGNPLFDLGLVAVIAYIGIKWLKSGSLPKGELVTFFLFYSTMVFFFVNQFWIVNAKALLHFAFILLFGLIYVKQLNNLNFAFLTIVILLFVDFFLYSMILRSFVLFEYFSLLAVIVILWTAAQTPSGFNISAAVVLSFIAVSLTVTDELFTGSVFFGEAEDERATFGDLLDKVMTGIGVYQKQISGALDARLQYAITGKVEENEFEPLGVYLQNVQSADPRYYDDEDVVVWGTIVARTLDDPIYIQAGCFTGKGKKKKDASDVDPEKKFSVFTLEEKDFACTFHKNDIDSGSKTITAFADFNFETLAFQKVYFINRERQRAMVREGLDVFEEFAIEDENPIAVYTNGPAGIEMGGSDIPLISVSESYIVQPSFSIKLANREGWEGEIKNLKEFVLFLPEHVELLKTFDEGSGENVFKCSNMKFVEYGESTCRLHSCVNFVKNECLDVCNGFIEDSSSCYRQDEGDPPMSCDVDEFGDGCILCKRGLNIDAYNSCADSCNENFGICQETCKSFFEEGEQKYNGYALDVNALDERDIEDLDQGKEFRCRIAPELEVLGNTPITTKSFRVKARYDYTVREGVTVNVLEVPDESVQPPINLVWWIFEGDKMRITWILSPDDPGSGVEGGEDDVVRYLIYRDGVEREIGSVESGENVFVDVFSAEVPFDAAATYRVIVEDNEGNKASIDGRLREDDTVAPPTELEASMELKNINLRWTLSVDDRVDGDVAGYNIYKKIDAGEYELVTTDPLPLPEGTNSFTDENLEFDIPYTYKVESVDQIGNVAMSDEVSITITKILLSSCDDPDEPVKQISESGRIYELEVDIESIDNCLEIDADNIILDGVEGQNYKISYGGPYSGTGILINGHNRVTIRNLVIDGKNGDATLGIKIASSEDITIEDSIILTEIGTGIDSSLDSNLVTIKDNTLTTSGASGKGIKLSSSDSGTIENNDIAISGNEGIGIVVSSSDSNTIKENTITTSGSDSPGIQLVSNSRDNLLEDNLLSTSGQSSTGLNLDGSNSNTIKENTIEASGINGDVVKIHSISDSNTLTENTIKANANFVNGIEVSTSSSNTISGNTIETVGLRGKGLTLFMSNSNTISGNTIETKTVAESAEAHGIQIEESELNELFDNSILVHSPDSLIVEMVAPVMVNAWNAADLIEDTNIRGGPWIGGNYYARIDGTGYSQICDDANADGICDDALTLASGNIDSFPLK